MLAARLRFVGFAPTLLIHQPSLALCHSPKRWRLTWPYRGAPNHAYGIKTLLNTRARARARTHTHPQVNREHKALPTRPLCTG